MADDGRYGHRCPYQGLFDGASENEIEMLKDGGEFAVVVAHDVVAFEQRILVVLRADTALEVVRHDEPGVVERQFQTFSLLHDANAPVEVGAKMVFLEVIRVFPGKVNACEESLVTDEHTVFE